MSSDRTTNDRLQPLLSAMLDGRLTDQQITELRRLLREDPAARREYLRRVGTHVMLKWSYALPDKISLPGHPVAVIAGPSVWFPSGHVLLSYLIAAVLVGTGIVAASMWNASDREQQVANYTLQQQMPQPATPRATAEPVLVGKITGMRNCQFSDPNEIALAGAGVPLGRTYALVSGLMEITYNSGEKVVLQGPATFEVESEHGGFLSFGRLRANAADRDERHRPKGSYSAQPKSPGAVLPSRLPSRLFAVHMPAGTVVGLDADFGVEADKSRLTWAHVFRGTVEFRLRGGIDKNGGIASVEQDQSARVEEIALQQVATVLRDPSQSRAIARRMPGPGLKEGEGGPILQLAAGEKNRDFAFRPGMVIDTTPAGTPNALREISTGASVPIAIVPNDLTYTVRATFELKAPVPGDAELRGSFLARGEVIAVRLNGKTAPAPEQKRDSPTQQSGEFVVREGFVEGTNNLEVDVVVRPSTPASDGLLQMRFELKGSGNAPRTPPAHPGATTGTSAKGDK